MIEPPADPAGDASPTAPIFARACLGCGGGLDADAVQCPACGRVADATWSVPFEPGRGPARRVFAVALLVALAVAGSIAVVAVLR